MIEPRPVMPTAEEIEAARAACLAEQEANERGDRPSTIRALLHYDSLVNRALKSIRYVDLVESVGMLSTMTDEEVGAWVGHLKEGETRRGGKKPKARLRDR